MLGSQILPVRKLRLLDSPGEELLGLPSEEAAGWRSLTHLTAPTISGPPQIETSRLEKEGERPWDFCCSY